MVHTDKSQRSLKRRLLGLDRKWPTSGRTDAIDPLRKSPDHGISTLSSVSTPAVKGGVGAFGSPADHLLSHGTGFSTQGGDLENQHPQQLLSVTTFFAEMPEF